MPGPGDGGEKGARPVGGWIERAYRGTASAKLLLFGEHAAVYGHPAVGAALPWTLTVSLRIEGGSAWRLEGVPPRDRPRLEELLRRLEELLPAFGERKGAVVVESEIPRSVGFGSSGALCVAVVEAASLALGEGAIESDNRSKWRLAHLCEHIFHGTPSGIDTGLSLLGGLRALYPSPPDLPRSSPLTGFPFHLVVGHVPRSGDTKSLVGGIRERIRAGDKDTEDQLRRLGETARRAIELFEAGGSAGGVELLGELCFQAQEDLRGLGLSTPELELLLRAGTEAGCVGGKLSGAGGGGAFFLAAPDRSSALSAADRVRAKAGEIFPAEAFSVFPVEWNSGRFNRLTFSGRPCPGERK